MRPTIDPAYFREKVQICLRLATELPWNNPVRYQLLLMAEDFQRREIELEIHAALVPRGSTAKLPELLRKP
jgi:hypothetical protein